MNWNPLVIFRKIQQTRRVRRALKAQLPFDQLTRQERARYLKRLEEKTFHPLGIAGVQDTILKLRHPVVFLDEYGNVVERDPAGQERLIADPEKYLEDQAS